MFRDHTVDEMVGKTLVEARQEDNDELVFVDTDGVVYRLSHDQECCESVWIEDLTGDLRDLVGEPLLVAYEDTNAEEPPAAPSEDGYGDDSHTWTFYRFGTVKGTVVVRFLGTSNGYYSESVSFSVDGRRYERD